MPGGVDQVQLVGLAVARGVEHAHRLRLDRDPALALEVHRVEQLRPHLARRHRVGQLEDAVRQRRLAVVDVRDDREVADVRLVHGLHYSVDGARAGARPASVDDPADRQPDKDSFSRGYAPALGRAACPGVGSVKPPRRNTQSWDVCSKRRSMFGRKPGGLRLTRPLLADRGARARPGPAARESDRSPGGPRGCASRAPRACR